MIKRAPHRVRFLSVFATALATWIIAPSAFAQDDAAPAEDDTLSDMGEEDEALPADGMEGQEAPLEDGSTEGDAGMSSSELTAEDLERDPDGSTQLLLGARYRMLITPKFLINMFGVDGGRTVVLHGVGPEIGGYFGKTADGFMVFFSPWFVGYGLEQTPFKGKNDDDSAWEIIESRMKVWYLSVDAMWDHKVIDRLSINVGLGAGLGIVTGKLRRGEAYVDDTDPDIRADSDKGWPNLSLCNGPNDPAGPQCPADGNYDFPNGSSDRWPVYPWLNFQVGVKYQPVDEFVARFELGLGSSGFWMGLGADYALFL